MTQRPDQPDAARLRLFIALWPDPATRDAIAAWQNAWNWPARAAPVRSERLHLTLHFLGDLPAQMLPALSAQLKVPCERFSLLLGKAEVWDGGAAVLRPESVPEGLMRLHAELGQRVAAFDLPLDARPYSPHVTLARRAFGARPPAPPQFHWRVEQGYMLVRSLPGGAGYQVIERFS